MGVGLLVILLWLLLVTASCAAPFVSMRRNGRRNIGRALLAPAGALLAFGIPSATIGAFESSWTPLRVGFVLAIGCGVVGLILCVIGWRAVIQRRARADECSHCGYPVGVATTCPECGKPMQPEEH